MLKDIGEPSLRIPGFVDLRHIRTSEFARVYEVTSERYRQPAIIKIARAGSGSVIEREAEVLELLRTEPGFPKLLETGDLYGAYWLAETKLAGITVTDEGLRAMFLPTRLRLLLSYSDRVNSAWGARLTLRDHKTDNFLWDENEGVGIFDLNGVRPLSGARLTLTNKERELISLEEVHAQLDATFDINAARRAQDLELQRTDLFYFVSDVVARGFVSSVSLRRDSLRGVDQLGKLISDTAPQLGLWVGVNFYRLLEGRDDPEAVLAQLQRQLKTDLETA